MAIEMSPCRYLKVVLKDGSTYVIEAGTNIGKFVMKDGCLYRINDSKILPHKKLLGEIVGFDTF